MHKFSYKKTLKQKQNFYTHTKKKQSKFTNKQDFEQIKKKLKQNRIKSKQKNATSFFFFKLFLSTTNQNNIYPFGTIFFFFLFFFSNTDQMKKTRQGNYTNNKNTK